MDFKYKLIGGILLNPATENELAYPSFLIPVFQKDKQLYTQITVRAKHPYTYLEDVFYEKLYMPNYNDTNSKITSSFVPLKKINKTVDLSKKVYMFALSKNAVLYGNLHDFTEQINKLKTNSETVLNAKETYNKKIQQFNKN